MNHPNKRLIQDDVGEFSHYTTLNTSPVTQIDFDMIQLDRTTNSNSLIENNQNQRRNDSINNIFEDLLLISDTASSTSDATLSNLTIESPRNSLTSNTEQKVQEDLIKIDIIQCQFSYLSKHQNFIETTEKGDMAFLCRCNKDIVSVCFNRMQYEAAIPLNQLIGFCVTEDRKILIKLKENYQHYFSHHLGEFPYLLEPTPMNYDPTNNKFDRARSLLLTPHPSERLTALSSLELSIEKLYFQKKGIRNEVITDDELKIYVTCVFPHERRAIALPISASLHKLSTDIESRFGKKSPTFRYKKRNEWIEIDNDEIWRTVKSQACGKRLLRMELHIW